MSPKEEFLQAMQTKRDIEKWVELPRCANCDRYTPTDSRCATFGPVPIDQAFTIHQAPCPNYSHDPIPF